jgi:hypothetical protein
MPRLTDRDYLRRHYELQLLRQQSPEVFAVVPAELQYAVHHYYQTAEVRTEDELIATRRHIQEDRSSLPQRASKAYARIVRGMPETD